MEKQEDPIEKIKLRIIGGYSESEIAEWLVKKGWNEEQVKEGIKQARQRIADTPHRLMKKRLFLVLKTGGVAVVALGVVLFFVFHSTEEEEHYTAMLFGMNDINQYSYEADINFKSHNGDVGMHFDYSAEGYVDIENQNAFYESNFASIFEFRNFSEGDAGTGAPRNIFGDSFYDIFRIEDGSAVFNADGTEKVILKDDVLYASWSGGKRLGYKDLYEIARSTGEDTFVSISKEDIEEQEEDVYIETVEEGIYSIFSTPFNLIAFQRLQAAMNFYPARDIELAEGEAESPSAVKRYVLSGSNQDIFHKFWRLTEVYLDNFLFSETIGRGFYSGFEESAQEQMEGSVWIDTDNNFVHRVSISVYMETLEQERAWDVELDVRFKDINVAKDIETPDEEKIVTVEEYISQP